jgi:hypothetical protein
MYRTFVTVKDRPELWVIDIETDNAVFGIAVGVYQYMLSFDVEWEIVSVGRLDRRTSDVLIEDIILN